MTLNNRCIIVILLINILRLPYRVKVCISYNEPYIYYVVVTPLPKIGKRSNIFRLYWCVAYLPSEASIIEH
jgi:hypothetical protein